MRRLILASRSPRRRELLRRAGYDFDVRPAAESVEREMSPDWSPAELVMEMAYRKAADVARQVASGPMPGCDTVLGCDTVAECDGRVLGKPADKEHARRMLETLRGRPHRVLSGLCLLPVPDGRPMTRLAVTALRMDPLTDEQIEEYLAGDGWKGKAGAFGYQDRTGWVHVVEGSESNVVGLPLELLAEMIEDLPRGRACHC